jgi:NAD+ synthase
MRFSTSSLQLDVPAEIERIVGFLRTQAGDMKREGAVVGLSGGVDSALTAALCVRAFGPERVLGLILPERESNPASAQFALKHAEQLGIRHKTVEITPVVEALGAYAARDEVIRSLVPSYTPQCRIKITLPPGLLDQDAYNIFRLTVRDSQGREQTVRLSKPALLGIVAATNIKLRVRMVQLNYHAEHFNYLVCGTTNHSEAVQGYFVKHGDGGVDLEPLEHLYKTQVYLLAEHLRVMREILERAPSPDTFSFPVSDEEFYYRMPYATLDLLLFAWEHQCDLAEVGSAMGLRPEQIQRAFRDFAAKHHATRHLRHMPPALA